MQTVPPTLSASQLAAALERIEALAKAHAESDAIARRIWNECRRLRAEANAQADREYAIMVVL